MKLIVLISNEKVLRYAIFALYLIGDSILATKTALLTFFGSYIITIIQLFYKDPRPFWEDGNIHGYLCLMNYEGPSDNVFILIFLPAYLNLIYLEKYSRRPKHFLSNFCFVL